MPEVELDPKKWVDRYSDYLFNYTITRVNDAVMAQDLVAETFLAGLKSAHRFKGKSTERTWLVSILKRKIIDYYRKINSNKGKAEVRMSYLDNNDETGDWLEERVKDLRNPTVEDDIEQKELGEALQECIAALPERYAIIFVQKTIDRMDTETICKEHDITASNLWVIIHRARVQLMECLNKKWYKID
ncbi:probable RNA polymerase sigma factor HI1459 [Nonlabens tegetincola]|uniref:Probable RNA polymerase sigma factor HI1459 n=1 Tax=Nonlabens tegetincola TaxID=323273 RepID=A0A090QNM6_9FLAO|nr:MULTISPECIES: sigma-70 family RNA polymerase sigma factor [Nonlabens]MEE2801250.1 sigma-70 family RNA polymerase sigma factor [Bacteroidota bacterium]ALM20028.1 RNA polymerase sigma-70 factor [Nonlabens sp. MIC269]ARN70932.1 RNA polymerase subunit sigma-70 [Nonlabens tegetincola]PQJ18588.1 RNA polymerase subunit sigma-70 [Nonlabens tegetincola]GAK97101.1 probable RNA polymerase sigma factor HI1459 [Nonlabens tegetincola]